MSNLVALPVREDRALPRHPDPDLLVLLPDLDPGETVDGWTEPDLRRHLRACARCRDEAQRAAERLTAWRALRPEPVVADGFFDRLAAEIDAEVDRAPALTLVEGDQPRSRAWLVAAAALLVTALPLALLPDSPPASVHEDDAVARALGRDVLAEVLTEPELAPELLALAPLDPLDEDETVWGSGWMGDPLALDEDADDLLAPL